MKALGDLFGRQVRVFNCDEVSYGGWQNLPGNLKQLFHPWPCQDLIAEVLLFAEGFKQAKTLRRKPVAAFSLSK